MSINNFLNNCIKLININKKNCKKYRNFLSSQKINLNKIKKIEQLPFIHVNQFKKNELYSIPKKNIYKIIRSSGTTGGNPSKIYLDKKNAYKQQKILNTIMGPITNGVRKPMIIFEKALLDKNNSFDASSAAVIGFSVFGKDHFYVRNKQDKFKYNEFNKYLKKNLNNEKIIFGFTFNLYNYLIRKIKKKKIKYKFKDSIIVHGGGWKKLSNLNISRNNFNKLFYKKYGIKKIFNYYGMVEQIGSIFLECEECGYFHETDHTKVLIRDKYLNVLDKNKKGFLQLISTVPESYPGNSILTEDYAKIVYKKCSKSKNYKQFELFGRVEKAEIRGCGDVI